MLAIVLLIAAAGARADAVEPQRSVEVLHTTLVEVMGDAEALGYAGRYQRLEPVVEASFDVPTIARIASGRHWSKLAEAERGRLIDVFGDFVVATYASRFDDYSGQRFETLGQDTLRPGLELVRTRIVRPEAEDVELNYVLREFESDSRIVDVHLEGKSSQVAIWRGEFGSILERDGFDGLIERLREKIRGYAET